MNLHYPMILIQLDLLLMRSHRVDCIELEDRDAISGCQETQRAHGFDDQYFEKMLLLIQTLLRHQNVSSRCFKAVYYLSLVSVTILASCYYS